MLFKKNILDLKKYKKITYFASWEGPCRPEDGESAGGGQTFGDGIDVFTYFRGCRPSGATMYLEEILCNNEKAWSLGRLPRAPRSVRGVEFPDYRGSSRP